MADKDFKVKSNLVVGSLTVAGPIVRHTDGTLTSHTALPIDKGGTGQTSASNAINALLPVQDSALNKFLYSDGTNVSWVIPNYSEVAVDGVVQNTRKTLNFVGASLEDDPVNNRTNVTIGGGSQYAQVMAVQDIIGDTII